MTYTPHVLVAFGGSWTTNPEEIWECTVRLSGDGGGGVTLDPDGYLADIHAPLATWFHLTSSTMDELAQLKWIKANWIDAEGHYSDPTATHVYDYGTPAVGANSHVAPGFCSLAYTWETAVARGPAHRGRIYPPNAAISTAGAFTVSDDIRLQNANAGKGLLTVLKNAAGVDGHKGAPVVASKIGGAMHPITGCSSDNIFDVQRRRKNRIKGARSAVIAA